MGCCSTILKLLLITSLSIGSILLYLHVECQRELEEKNSNKFNDVYYPDETDCVAELPFVKAGTESVDINLGLEFMLVQWLPCPLTKLITLTRTHLLGVTLNEDYNKDTDVKNVTFLDVRKHNPGSVEQTGFTYIHLDEV